MARFLFLESPRKLLLFVSLLLSQTLWSQTHPDVAISGDLMRWHPVTIEVNGPQTSESNADNPFLNFRFNITFSKNGQDYLVPGYFAADGDAAESSASEGSIWKAHFVPHETGTWDYTISFRQGNEVALSLDPLEGSPTEWEGIQGSFSITETNKSGLDFRARGILRDVGEHFLRLDNGEWFLASGAGSPENLLAYSDFDNTYSVAGSNTIKDYSTHVADWQSSDPTWHNGKGKGIIGAINYLTTQGVNSKFFIPLTLDGDGHDTWPWVEPGDRLRYDVSKLDQWDILFQHMSNKGMSLHMVLQEYGNEFLLDGGVLGTERKLYYRELAARFGYHHGIKWNIGEEHKAEGEGNTDAQRKAYIDYIDALDSYNHPIVMHSWPGIANYQLVYGPLLGKANFTGMSMQIHGGETSTSGDKTNRVFRDWRNQSAQAGRKWIMTMDECCGWKAGVLPDGANMDNVRRDEMWGSLMGGGAGFDWYLGQGTERRDENLDDFRIYDFLWKETATTLDFFRSYIPFQDMQPFDELTPETENHVLAIPGQSYLVYLKFGGSTQLDLQNTTETFNVSWFNPREGGPLVQGTVPTVQGPGNVSIGLPPSQTGQDWAALITTTQPGQNPVARFSLAPGQGTVPLEVSFDASASTPGQDATLTRFQWNFGDGTNGEGVNTSHTYTQSGSYIVTLTITDSNGDGDSQSRTVTVNPEQEPPAEGTFIESDGLLVIEAEHPSQNISRNQQQWTSSDQAPGFSGESALFAGPDTGSNYQQYVDQSPEVSYQAQFSNAGTYYIWLRVWVDGSGSNRIHTGLNGLELSSAARMVSFDYNQWSWTRIQNYDDIANLTIAAGKQTLNVWMQKDGIYLDKILLTTDESFVPQGLGPPESEREGGQSNTQPVARFNALPGQGIAPLEVTFDASDSSPGEDASIIDYQWDFGDGTNGQGMNVSHTYTQPGSYDATLTISDSNGDNDARTQTIRVDPESNEPVLPEATFSASPDQGVAPLSVMFDATASTPGQDASITDYQWNFGDGTNGQGPTVSHTYNEPGTYTASLTIIDSNGDSDGQTRSIIVNADDPPTTGPFLESNGLLVIEAEHFAQTILRNGQEWNSSTQISGFSGESALFAGPDTGSNYQQYVGLSPEATYEARFENEGTYYVWLRLWVENSGSNRIHAGLNGQGLSSSARMVSFNYNQWSWTRIQNSDGISTMDISTGDQTLNIWMQKDGIFLDKILLTTDAGFVPQGSGPPESMREGGQPNTGPLARFSATPDQGTAPLKVAFDASSSTPGEAASITDFEWDFGDGTNGEGQTVTHTYAEPGTYTASLIITDSNGDSDSQTRSISVDEEGEPVDIPVVTRFILINADNNQPVEGFENLADGDLINIALLPSTNLNIEAIANQLTGSIAFGFNGNNNFRTENVAPYALGGDRSGNYNSLNFSAGTQEVSATPYSENNKQGTAGPTKTVTFEVIDDPGLLQLTITEGSQQSQMITLEASQPGAAVSGNRSGQISAEITRYTPRTGSRHRIKFAKKTGKAKKTEGHKTLYLATAHAFNEGNYTYNLVYRTTGGIQQSTLIHPGVQFDLPADFADFEELQRMDASADELISAEEGIVSAYPNPFGSSLQYGIQLEESAPVTIALFDVLGRQVMKLHEGQLEGGRYHTFEATTLNLPAGVYFLTLRNGSSIKTHRIVKTAN